MHLLLKSTITTTIMQKDLKKLFSVTKSVLKIMKQLDFHNSDNFQQNSVKVP